jgi:hypothetical protein
MLTSSRQSPAHSSALPLAPSATPSSRRLSWLFWMLVMILLPLMVRASLDFGATWDEPDRHLNGQAILEYYQGLRTREEAHYGTMYPGLFDVIPAWLEKRVAARQAWMPVTVWGRPEHLVRADAARFPELTVTRNQTASHHLQIRLLRGSITEVREMKTRSDAVYRVTTADGAVLCAVYPGPDFEELHRRLQAVSRPPS